MSPGESLLHAHGAGLEPLAPFPAGGWEAPAGPAWGARGAALRSGGAEVTLRAGPFLHHPLICLVNNFHVWEKPEIFYLLLSQHI